MDGFGAFDDQKTWEFYTLEYPGYGSRAGSPSQESLVAAAQQALDKLQENDARPVFLMGESLGSGVASLLAGKNPKKVAGIFLITPFSSVADVAASRFPVFPVRWILKDRFDSKQALKDYSGPVAILLAGRDSVVPARFGQQLFESYRGPKRKWMQPKADHNTLDLSPSASWWREVSKFLLQNR